MFLSVSLVSHRINTPQWTYLIEATIRTNFGEKSDPGAIFAAGARSSSRGRVDRAGRTSDHSRRTKPVARPSCAGGISGRSRRMKPVARPYLWSQRAHEDYRAAVWVRASVGIYNSRVLFSGITCSTKNSSRRVASRAGEKSTGQKYLVFHMLMHNFYTKAL